MCYVSDCYDSERQVCDQSNRESSKKEEKAAAVVVGIPGSRCPS